MAETQIKSIRLSDDLLTRVLEEADRLGVSFNEFAVHALERALGNEGDESIVFMTDLAFWLEQNFNRHAFPEDVTLQVFHHIRDDRNLRARYRALIRNADGGTDPEKLTGMHRRIGRLVKRALDAEVFGRSLPLDPEEHLIRSHALLRPGKEQQRRNKEAEQTLGVPREGK